MADTNNADNQPKTIASPRQDNPTNGFLAPNNKPAWLQEVEDDATYIQKKRFEEHYQELEREAEKKAIAAARAEKKGN